MQMPKSRMKKLGCKQERLLSSPPLTWPMNNQFSSAFAMQLYGVLVLFVTLSAACALRCYTCTATDPRSCTDTKACAVIFNRCFSLRVDGYTMVTKGCQTSLVCAGAMDCCEGSLCNSATPTGPSVILLLVSSAMIMLSL